MSLLKSLILILFLSQLISAQLTSESVAMRPCYPRVSYKNANPVFLSNPLNVWYVKYGSRHQLRSYAEAFLGYSPINQAQIEAMNLKITIAGTLLSNMGYKSEFFQQACVPSTLLDILGLDVLGILAQANCSTIPATASKKSPYLQNISPSDQTLLWTDNSNVLVMSRCIGSGPSASEDWKIVSLTPTISPVLLSYIISNLTIMGFDTTGYENFLLSYQ